MAGSYKHCCKKDGSFRTDDFTDMIENLGDAYEACEEMHWIIQWLTREDKHQIDIALEQFYSDRRRKAIERIARKAEELGDYDKFIRPEG